MLANSQSPRARGRLQKISHPLVVYLQVTETEFVWRHVTSTTYIRSSFRNALHQLHNVFNFPSRERNLPLIIYGINPLSRRR